MSLSSDEIYSVTDFIELCNKKIEKSIPSCWISGEISNYRSYPHGHNYFSIKDKTSQLSCVLFRLNKQNIRFDITNGMAVILKASPNIYKDKGIFQLVVEKIEPTGIGNLNLQIEQLKGKLKKEGLFDNKYKKKLPKLVKEIAVVSSSSGAVIKDIIKVIKRRYPFVKIKLFDTAVQGYKANQKVAYAINKADSYNCDVLIVARGGGSLEDIMPFNEEDVARAVFACKTPVISAIGHEIDYTICDFVADIRAPTPSAAAEIVVPDKLEVIEFVKKYERVLINLINSKISYANQSIGNLQKRIINPIYTIKTLMQRVDDNVYRTIRRFENYINYKTENLKSINATLMQYTPKNYIRNKIERQKHLHLMLINHINSSYQNSKFKYTKLMINFNNLNKNIINSFNYRLKSLITNLDNLSPLKTLARGYSITKNEKDKIIQSKKDININDNIKTNISQKFVLYSKVFKIRNDS